MQKYLALVCNVLLFNFICAVLYVLGFLLLGEEIQANEMACFHLAQVLMQLEVGTICFLISAFTKKSFLGEQ